MDERRVGRTNALTIDHLTARLEELERAFAALQRAYVELQGAARAAGRAPLGDDVAVHAGAPGESDERAWVPQVDTHLHA